MKLFGRGTRSMRLLERLSLVGLLMALVGCDAVFGLQETRDIRPQPCGWDLQVGPDSRQVITSVANGGNDRVVFAGQYADKLDFLREAGPAKEGNGVFVGGYNGATDTLWNHTISGDSLVVAALPSGIVVLAGNSGFNVDCGDGVVLPDGAHFCAFGPEGKPSWGWGCSSSNGKQTVDGISAAGSEHFIIVGGFNGTVYCGENGGELNEGFGSTDIFVYKLREVGSVEWARSFGGMGHQLARTVAVDGAGDVLVAGQYTDSFAFPDGGAILEYDPSNFGSEDDIFVAKLSSDGKHQWSKRFGAKGDDSVTGIAVNPDGDVFIVGTTGGTIRSVTTAGTIIEHSVTEKEFDYFLLKLSGEDGSGQWIRGFRSPGGSAPNMSVAANSTEVVVSGTFNGSLVLDEETSVELKGKSDRDLFIAAFSSDNQFLWHKHWATNTEYPGSSALAIDSTGSIVWGGEFFGSEDFGCGMRTSRGTDGILVNILP